MVSVLVASLSMCAAYASGSPASAAGSAAAAAFGRGALIVFEGADRCGKSTQVKLLVDALAARGLDAQLQRFPDRTTPTGVMIDRYLKCQSELDDHAVHLLFAANRWEAASALGARVRGGGVVVCDRYAYSGVAFSSAKPGMPLAWCRAPDVGLPRPDAVVYLDVPSEVAESRGSYGEERYEKRDMQRRVVANFRALIDEDAAATPGLWHVLDATRSIDAIHADVLAIVTATMERVRDQPIGALWQPEGADGTASSPWAEGEAATAAPTPSSPGSD